MNNAGPAITEYLLALYWDSICDSLYEGEITCVCDVTFSKLYE